jgi:hypothetical protein
VSVCGLERASAQVAQLLDPLAGRNDLTLLGVSDESVKIGWEFALGAGVQETKGFAVLVALMSVEKH